MTGTWLGFRYDVWLPRRGPQAPRSRIQTDGHALPKEIEHAEESPPVRIPGSHENQPRPEDDQPQEEDEAQTHPDVTHRVIARSNSTLTDNELGHPLQCGGNRLILH